MRDLIMQRRTTVQGLAGVVNTITQDEEYWLDTTGITEVGALIQCTGLTLPGGGTISLSIETAPTPDENLFVPIAPPIVFDGVDVTASSAPIQLKTLRTPSNVAPAGLLRWKASISGGTGTWGLTFGIHIIPGRSRFFVPTDITGNVGWYRSDIGITKDAATKQVSKWTDQSGQNHDMLSSGGNQPVWAANQINGQPALSFDSAGPQFLATAAFSLGTFTVLLVTTAQNGTNGWFFTRSSGATTHDTLYGSTNQTMYTDRGGTVSAWDTTLGASWGQWVPTSLAKLLVLRFDGTHAGHTLRINGANNSLNNNIAADPGTGTTSDSFTVGARADGVLPAKIKVAEVIVYDHALSTDELSMVEEYLRRRYALY